MVSISPQGHHDCPPRDPRAMAPSRLPPVLALEIPFPWRPAANRRGPARADPADERRQSAVGSAAHPPVSPGWSKCSRTRTSANGRSGPAASPWRRISTFRCRLKKCVLLQPGLQERVHYKGAQPTFRTSLSTTRGHHQRQVRPIAVRKALRSGGIADGHKEQGLNQSRQVEAIDLAGAIAGFHKSVVAELARRLRKSCKERAGRHLGPY